jgi:serine/threonine protein kinase
MTIDQFGKALVASGLMTADDVKATWNAIPPDSRPKDGAAFGKLLADKGLLTPFQAAELLAGRGARLIMGDYTIVTQIGAGGMGQVYKAQHRRMKRTVALKVMSNAAMQDEAAVKRFQREVHAAAKLEHPNIVTAYDSGESGSVKYLVMQFVDGGDLSELVKKNGRLGVEQAVGYVIQAAKGLAFAHGEGVIHRDIKPANLLLDKKGVVKILDMGLARFEDGGDGLTATEQVMGTVDYMSPEQAANTKGCDGRADIYSLGCTLWYLLTGKKLYEADTLIARLMLHRDGPLPSLVKERDDAPWPLEQALHKMIAKRVQDRYQTMDEAIGALAPFGGNAMAGGASPGSSPSVSHNADLASFMQSMNTGGGTKTNISATQAKPATSTNLDATAQFTAPEAGTDPKSQVLPKSATLPKPQPATKGAAKKPAKPGNNKTKLIAGGALVGLLLLAGIIVKIRDKDGNVVAEVNAPTGTSAEVITTPQPGVKPLTTALPVTPTLPTLTFAQLFDSPDYEWSTPENLGPTINHTDREGGVSLSADQLLIYFDGQGGRREATRSSTSVPFNATIGSISFGDPCLSGDGLSMIGRTTVEGKKDVLTEVVRPTRESKWDFSGPNLCAQADTPEIERAISISADGLTLIFRTFIAAESQDLWIARRTSRQAAFGPAEKLGPFVNTGNTEARGFMLGDGRTILFLRDATWRYTLTNASGTQESLPLRTNPKFPDDTWISPDGRTAYFTSNRPGGYGNVDIYVTRLVPKNGATPTPQALTAAQRLESPDYVWSEPENLGPNVNRNGYESLPTLTADQLDMIVEAGVESGSHLREFRRNSVDAPWGEGKQLLEGEHEDFPFLSRDGLTLIYSTKFPLAGHQGNFDLYERRRANRNAPWGPSRNLGPTINSPQDDTYGSLSPDGLSLAYSSERSTSGHTKIWTARRASLDSPWEKPQEAAAAINVGGVRGPLWLDDGKTMIFHGPGGLRMTFASSTGAVSALLLRVPHPFGQNTRISLSPDGQVAYFDADKPGGFGGKDIYVTRLVPKAGATPSNPAVTNSTTAAGTDNPATVAKWLLDNKKLGRIRVVIDGRDQLVTKVPTGPFKVVELDFSKSNNAGQPLTEEEVARLAVFTDLESLELSTLTDAGLVKLAPLKKLKSLFVNGSALTPAAVATLRQFPELEHLRSFGGDEWLKALAGMPTLRSMAFFRDKLSPEAMSLFPQYPNLKELLFHECIELEKVPNSFVSIAPLKDCKNLMKLTLAGSAVDGAELAVLSGFTQLLELYLNTPSITEAQVKQLAAALPRCKITCIDAANQPHIFEPTAPQATVPAATTGKLFMHHPEFAQWLKDTAAQPAEAQLAAVSKKFIELHPGFDGKFTDMRGTSPPTIEGGVVTQLKFNGPDITDISPLRALTGLKTLSFGGPSSLKGKLTDLSPLVGMQVTDLTLSGMASTVTDLSQLQGLRLEKLTCRDLRTLVDIAALQGTPLKHLDLSGTAVADVAPLQGMPLEVLVLPKQIKDLAVLQGMPLTRLECTESIVSDLSPLRGMPLETFWCKETSVADLSPLYECKSLKELNVEKTRVSPAVVAALQKALPNCKVTWDDPAKAKATPNVGTK